MQILIIITLIKNKIKRAMRALSKTIILARSIIMISIYFCEKELFKRRNLLFISTKDFKKFELSDEILFHIINVNLCAIQINNTSFKIVIIFKNSCLDYVYKYEKKNCYIVSLEYNYLAIEFSSKFDS